MNRANGSGWVWVAMLLAPQVAPGAQAEPQAAVDGYDHQEMLGWSIQVSHELQRERDLCEETLQLLHVHLFQVQRAVPQDALRGLRGITIWVEKAHPLHPCMCYHPDENWLRKHQMNPEKAGCVEIANARNFLQWTHDQPSMVLHELAHAYHHQFLENGFDNRSVRELYDAAVASGKYLEVGHIRGQNTRGYAINNRMEYFAECSEAFFGTNDFYPFVRSELQQHDPEMYRLLGLLWGVPECSGPRPRQ